MPGKKTGKTGTKKPPAKKPAKRAAGSVRSSSKSSKSGKNKRINKDKTPVYVLLIMALFTVIVLLINNFMFKLDKKDIPDRGIISTGDIKESTPDKRIGQDTAIKEPDQEKISGKDGIQKENVPDRKPTSQSEFNIYLVKFDSDENMSLSPVKRRVKADSPLAEILNELIRGPNQDEKKRGLLTAVPEDLKIRDIQIQGRNAVLDFNDSIEENADGQILLTRIDQLVYTATQFDGIDGVVIRVNGKQKKFLGGEGLSINGPIRRRNSN